MHRSALPVLRPCANDWDEMTGTEQRRHCASCDREVIHLSAMSERAARRIVARAEPGTLCVRYRFAPDGMVRFSSPRARGVSRLAVGVGVASLLATASPAIADTTLPAPTKTAPAKSKAPSRAQPPREPEQKPAPPPHKPPPDDSGIMGGI